MGRNVRTNTESGQNRQELFAKATIIETTDTLVERARLRIQVGNPPGKEGSLGDAISWEALLSEVPEKDELFFITDDRRYVSVLNDNEFNGFLLGEWTQRKRGRIGFYKRLSSFFKDKFPDIKLATELEKELLIRDFADSPNFSQTQNIISKLSKFTEFTAAQLSEIIEAALSNSQVSYIMGDSDVYAFLKSVTGEQKSIEPEIWREFQKQMARAAPEDSDDDPIPF